MAKLPDWIQDCRDFCDSYLTEPYPRAKGADYWQQHGSDLVHKIEQQMVRIGELEAKCTESAKTLGLVLDDDNANVTGYARGDIDNVRLDLLKAAKGGG